MRLVRKVPSGSNALVAANHLLEFARDSTGHDNITVVVAIF